MDDNIFKVFIFICDKTRYGSPTNFINTKNECLHLEEMEGIFFWILKNVTLRNMDSPKVRLLLFFK